MAVEDSVAQTQIRAFVERVERLDEELKAINDDKKEIFAEARGNGFDVPALKQVIKIRRQDANERMEREAIVELYMSALGMIETPDFDEPRVHVQVRVREASKNAAPAPTEITEQQAAPQPASDLTVPPSPQGQVATHYDIAQPISNEAPMAIYGDSVDEPTGHLSETVEILPGGVQLSKDGRVDASPAVSNSIPDATPAGAVVANRSGVTGGESAATNPTDDGSSVASKAKTAKSVEPSGSAAPAVVYPAPGVVTWESTPPEGAIAHPYATCWPVKVIDVSGGVREPVVKIGKLILDGRGRMFAARGVDGGKGIEYPVVQYDGADPLMDCIRWNLASRPSIDPHNMKMIAGKLARMEPTRADDIMQAFGLEMAEAVQ